MTHIPFSYDDTQTEKQQVIIEAASVRMKQVSDDERKRAERQNIRAYQRESLRDTIQVMALILGLLLGLSAVGFLGTGFYHFIIGLRDGGTNHIALGAILPIVSVPLFKATFWVLTAPYPELRQKTK